MTLDRRPIWSSYDPLLRLLTVGIALLALMALATALFGMEAMGVPGMDITVDPAGLSIAY
jgi:hypothetical protein